jgi:hypothetical protein
MPRNIEYAIVLFAVSQTFIIALGLINFAILGAVNQRLPTRQRFPFLWWHPAKSMRLISEYRRLYPRGRLFLAFALCLVAALLSFAASALALAAFR